MNCDAGSSGRDAARSGSTLSKTSLSTCRSPPPVMRRAAQLWADVRNEGRPTAPDPALDGDVILAAQTLTLEDELTIRGIIGTTNPDHLSRYVAAADWKDIGSATSRDSDSGGKT